MMAVGRWPLAEEKNRMRLPPTANGQRPTSPRDGDFGEDASDEALLGRGVAAQSAAIFHQNTMRQHGAGEALDVFRNHEVASADHRQRLTGFEGRQRAARRYA